MQFVRFLIVGGGATAVQYLVFWAGMQVQHAVSVVVVSSGAYLVGSLVSYALNYTFTFGSDAPHRRVMPKFYAMVLAGWLLNTSLMALMVGMLRINAWAAQVAATAICLLVNFLVSRHFVFKGKS